jgi:hypothetical protein
LREVYSITPLKLLSNKEILIHLKRALKNTSQGILVVGPWLDAYFTRIIINSVKSKEIDAKFIVRIDDDVIDKKTLSALNLAKQNLEKFQAKSLENLHSKVILIDHEIFLGSANWYWYSLHESVEIVINGDISNIPDLQEELDNYWKEGTVIPDEKISEFNDFEPIKSLPAIRQVIL